MKTMSPFALTLLVFTALFPAFAHGQSDTIYLNGKIYTVNEAQPWAEAVAIKDGKFVAVGSNADVKKHNTDTTKVIDLGGKFVMPGMIDVHTHVLATSVDKANLFIEDPNSKEAMLEQIKTFAEANPELPYIRGLQWNLGVFENNSPRKEWLDAIVPDRPVYIYSQTGHEAWVNSKALELAKLEGRKQDNLYIWDVDEKTGEPSGTIKEYTMSLLEQALEPTVPGKLAPELAKLVETFSAAGFTSFKEAGAEVWTVTAANILDRKGELNARVFPAWFHLGHIGAMTREESKAVAADWKKYKTPMVYPRYIKMYADGSPSSHSSLLFEDYADRQGFKGSISFPYDLYVEDFCYFNKLGLGMLVHAFGDGSGGKMIEAFEEMRRLNGDNGIPLHYSHSVMTSKKQLERLSKISDISVDFLTLQYQHPAVTANFQPAIGEERYQQWLNAKHAAEIGIPYGFGGDWPSAILPVPNGFYEMQAFVTRKNPYDPGLPSLNVEQALTLEQAVYGYTLGGAHNLGFDWPEKLGSIKEGKLADLIVLDRDIFEIPIDELHLTQVEHTVVNGRIVFDRDEKEAQLEIVDVEITNKELDNAVDAADLNLLVEDELDRVSRGCLGESVSHDIHPGAPTTPEAITLAFGTLSEKGYRYARPAREIYWENTDSNYWIQWTIKDDVDILFAYDPDGQKVVEVLRVREKPATNN